MCWSFKTFFEFKIIFVVIDDILRNVMIMFRGLFMLLILWTGNDWPRRRAQYVHLHLQTGLVQPMHVQKILFTLKQNEVALKWSWIVLSRLLRCSPLCMASSVQHWLDSILGAWTAGDHNLIMFLPNLQIFIIAQMAKLAVIASLCWYCECKTIWARRMLTQYLSGHCRV